MRHRIWALSGVQASGCKLVDFACICSRTLQLVCVLLQYQRTHTTGRTACNFRGESHHAVTFRDPQACDEVHDYHNDTSSSSDDPSSNPVQLSTSFNNEECLFIYLRLGIDRVYNAYLYIHIGPGSRCATETTGCTLQCGGRSSLYARRPNLSITLNGPTRRAPSFLFRDVILKLWTEDGPCRQRTCPRLYLRGGGAYVCTTYMEEV